MSHPNHENIKAEYLDTFSEEEIQLIEMTRNQNFQTLKIIKRD